MKTKIEAAQRALDEAEVRFAEAGDAIENAPADITEEALSELTTEFDSAESDVVRSRAQKGRLERIAAAREAAPVILGPEPVSNVKEELTYQAAGKASFFRDIVFANSDREARKRLDAHDEEMRDITSATGAAGGGGFIPPIYLGEYWAEYARPGRPFADKIPTFPFPPDGLTISVPKVETGASVAVQTAENEAPSETDVNTDMITSDMVTIAGQQDVSRQALERSFPGLDMIIFRDLMSAYDGKLDSQLLSGTGANGQHLGLRAVSSPNTVSYTDASPTGTALLSKVYDAIQKIASNRFRQPDMIIMHPRRAAWLAATQASTFPVFQQGGLFHAVGSQDNGFVGTFAGLPVLSDPNVTTVQGVSTNQDEIYVVYTPDFLLSEGPVRQATYEEVLSGNLTIRLQLFGYSFSVLQRQAKSITIVSGTGLTSPSF